MCFLCRYLHDKGDIWRSNAFSRRNNTVVGAIFIGEGPFLKELGWANKAVHNVLNALMYIVRDFGIVSSVYD